MAKAKGLKRPAETPSVRASQVLLEVLSKNPGVEEFTVQRIVDTIGGGPTGVSLLLFSIPGFLPTPGARDLAGLPTGAVASQMIAGRKRLKLPKFILEKKVPRRSLAVAIHAVVPFLRRAEKAARPRWKWTEHPAAQRALGVLIFVLALAIALPFVGFNAPHAAAIFIISLGMVEKDGLAIMIGVAAGLVSLTIAAISFSKKRLPSKIFDFLKGLWNKFTMRRVSTFFRALAAACKSFVTQDWSSILVLWDPERSAQAKSSKQIAAKRPAMVQRRAEGRVRRPAPTSIANLVVDSSARPRAAV